MSEKQMTPADTRQPREYQQDAAREEHAIPHDVHFVECNQSAEQAREACKQHAQVQLDKPFLRLVHSGCKGTTISEKNTKSVVILSNPR